MPASVPPAIDALVRSMTAHDPLERPRTMRDVREGIAAHRNASGTVPLPLADTALPPEAPASVAIRLPVPRKRTLQICASVALVAIVTAWQWPNMAPTVKAFVTGEKAPAPYSEMASMAAGMEALRVFDRDSSQIQAIDHFNAILKQNPVHAAASAGLSLAYSLRYISNGRDGTWLQQADAASQQALALDNQLALSHVARAWVLEFQGKRDDALSATANALNLDPQNLLGLVGKARLLIQMGKFELAKTVLDSTTQLYPKERLVPMFRGIMLYRQGNYASAEKAFRTCIELDPRSTSAYAYLNAVLLRLNRNDEALLVLQRGLQFQPHWELYSNLGTSLFAKADYLGAVKAFEKAVLFSNGNPRFYQLWANLADAQRWIPAQKEASQQSYRQAIKLLHPILARMPEDVTSNSRMALFSAYVGDTKQAINSVEKALAKGAELPDVQFRAALTHELTGNRKASLAALQEAVKFGYPINLIESAPDLLNLRRDPRYEKFITNIERDRKI